MDNGQLQAKLISQNQEATLTIVILAQVLSGQHFIGVQDIHMMLGNKPIKIIPQPNPYQMPSMCINQSGHQPTCKHTSTILLFQTSKLTKICFPKEDFLKTLTIHGSMKLLTTMLHLIKSFTSFSMLLQVELMVISQMENVVNHGPTLMNTLLMYSIKPRIHGIQLGTIQKLMILLYRLIT